MKKLLLFSILLGCFAPITPVTAYNCEYVKTADFIFGCDDGTKADKKYEYNDIIQTLGWSKCLRHDGTEFGDKHINARYTCTDPDGQTDHWSKDSNTKYCSDSLFRSNTVQNAVYTMPDCSSNGVAISLKSDQLRDGNSNGCKGDNQCIKVTCQDGYVADTNNCVSIETKQNEMCKATSAGVSVSGNFKLSIGGQTNTGDSTRMICRKQADIAQKYESEELKDVCAADIHAFLPKPAGNTANDAKYFKCTNIGWEQQQLDKCTQHDNITSLTSCGTDDNCIIKIYEGTNSAEEVTFPKHDDQYSGGLNTIIRDYCYRFVCADGYTWYNNNCTDNATIQEELQEQERKKQACTDSFGTWANDQCTCDPGKNLVSDRPYETCKCKDNYDPDETTKSCVPTDTEAKRLACVKMNDDIATWDEDREQCICHESGYEWKYDRTNRTGNCEMLASRAACEELGPDIARWDTELDECKCEDNGQEFRDGQCVDTEETINTKATIARSTITTAVNTLERLISDANLQTSKWKNAEGKFNTARLASDATAGIVLGTTSALITSKLVKKHQVQDGFEDIHCTIGGQTVADWGDEFTIGIQ